VHPAVVEGLGGRLGQPPITAAQQRSGYADLARLALLNRVAVLVEQRGAEERRGLAAARQPLVAAADVASLEK
jgi:hypothetical protein